jgi:calcineurin-like phosphoesterase family protein
MHDVIIKNINETVSSRDTLYILGDVACIEYDPTDDLKLIHCPKILIKGNHDAKWLKHRHFRNQFEEIYDIKAIKTDDTRIILCHYPMAEWDGFWKGHWHFYGHIHNSNEGAGLIMSQIPRSVNVGVDVNDFKPKTARQLMGLPDTTDDIKWIYEVSLEEPEVLGSGSTFSRMATASNEQDALALLVDGRNRLERRAHIDGKIVTQIYDSNGWV